MAVSIIEIRQAQTISWGAYDFGTVNSVLVEMKELSAGRDSQGVTIGAGYDVKLSFNMMDNDRSKINTFLALTKTKSTLTIIWQTSEKFVMANCLPFTEILKIDGDGKPSEIKISFDRILKQSEVAGLIQEIT